jgi:EmrB/QacA subfamily drug resistance transporter
MADLSKVRADSGRRSSLTLDQEAELLEQGIDPDHYRRRWWMLGTLCLSLLIIMVGNTSLNVALPRIMQDLEASQSSAQWMVEAYSLVFAGLLFTMGNLGDRYGRKGILQLGLFLFGGATAYAALLADSTSQLIGSRVVMGVAAAMVMPATLSIITNVFPREERARAVALWAGISGAGTALGPLISGFVVEHWGWNEVFLVNLPIILAAIVGGAFFVPRLRSEHSTPLDIPGAILSFGALSLLVYALIEAPSEGWLAPSTILIGTAALLLLTGFILWELRARAPMLDVRLFKVPAFGVSALVLTLVFFSLMGMFFSISLLLQFVWGYSPLEAAVRMLPVTLAIMISAPRSAALAARFGKRRVVATGMWMVAAGVAVMATVPVAGNYPLMVGGLFVMAFGMGLAMSPTTDLLMSAVPREKAGMGSAMNDTTRELGGSLGVAIFGSLLASRYVTQLAPALSGLPGEAKEAAEGSLPGAMQVAGKLGPAGQSLLTAAKESWMSGFRFSQICGVVVLALAGLIAFKFLPDQAADIEEIEDRDERVATEISGTEASETVTVAGHDVEPAQA